MFWLCGNGEIGWCWVWFCSSLGRCLCCLLIGVMVVLFCVGVVLLWILWVWCVVWWVRFSLLLCGCVVGLLVCVVVCVCECSWCWWGWFGWVVWFDVWLCLSCWVCWCVVCSWCFYVVGLWSGCWCWCLVWFVDSVCRMWGDVVVFVNGWRCWGDLCVVVFWVCWLFCENLFLFYWDLLVVGGNGCSRFCYCGWYVCGGWFVVVVVFLVVFLVVWLCEWWWCVVGWGCLWLWWSCLVWWFVCIDVWFWCGLWLFIDMEWCWLLLSIYVV